MRQPNASADARLEKWQETLAHGHLGHKTLQRAMRLLPGPPRCKICNNPFGGAGGRICRFFGFKPSKKNPHICALCCEDMPLGGAEIEAAILFADVRGSTEIAEQLGPARFAAALNQFYATATEVLVRHDATVDKLIGDEVMAFFIPGFAGRNFKRSAISAGQTLLRKLGYDGRSEPSLPVGIGIDAGTAFVGNVGGEDFVDFTVLGDPVNTAARIQAAAGSGELLVGEDAFAAVADCYPDCRPRLLEAKGKQARLTVRSVPLGS